MAEKRRLNLSINLSAPHQREAWNILRAIPAGQRTDAVCRMICQAEKKEKFLNDIRALFREELRSVEFISAKEKFEQPQAGDVDESVLGFLLALQQEDSDMTDPLF